MPAAVNPDTACRESGLAGAVRALHALSHLRSRGSGRLPKMLGAAGNAVSYLFRPSCSWLTLPRTPPALTTVENCSCSCSVGDYRGLPPNARGGNGIAQSIAGVRQHHQSQSTGMASYRLHWFTRYPADSRDQRETVRYLRALHRIEAKARTASAKTDTAGSGCARHRQTVVAQASRDCGREPRRQQRDRPAPEMWWHIPLRGFEIGAKCQWVAGARSPDAIRACYERKLMSRCVDLLAGRLAQLLGCTATQTLVGSTCRETVGRPTTPE